MRISFEWLKEFIDTGISPEETASTLTMIGHEVEGVEKLDDDIVFEVNITPNRPDCLSTLGIAREVSAATGQPLGFPEFEIRETIHSDFKVEIADKELCRRYAGRIVKDIKVSASPDWMKKRLEKCGIRPINNIVDVTNYVLLELGHPLHAFDLDTLKGKMIGVKVAGKDRKLKTLDGIERKLPKDALLIWDGERPVAIAGVMGGADTEVTESTKNIFIESAWFKPSSVRRTSKALGLSTESSTRFEKGTDIEMLEKALDRTAFLIQKLAGGSIENKIDAYPVKFVPPEVRVRYEKINRILGTDISKSDITDIAKRLNLRPLEEGDSLKVTPPPYRLDISRDYDIIEEVARLYGYGRIPTVFPKADISKGGVRRKRKLMSQIKEALRKCGLNEAINYSFMNEDYFGVLDMPEDDIRRKTIAIKNPLRKEESLLRTTLIPSLVENLIFNISRGMRDVRLFELSKVFINEGREPPTETWHAGGIYFVEKGPALWRETAPDFYIVKGILESLFDELKVSDFSFMQSKEPFLHPGQSADVYISGAKIGFLGALSPAVIEKIDIKSKTAAIVFEVDLDRLISIVPISITFSPIPKFPYVERDIAIIVDEGVGAADIIALIKKYPSEVIEEVDVFDSYKGKGIPEGRKSLAFGIRYRSKERTLTDDEVNTIHQALTGHIIKETAGQLR